MDEDYKFQRNIWRSAYLILLVVFIATNHKNKEEDKEEIPKEPIEQTFEAGEHIISVPIDNPKKEVRQYDYHDGYTVIDIEDKYILYINNEEVICKGYSDEEEKVRFTEFGEPTKSNSKTLKLVPTTEE